MGDAFLSEYDACSWGDGHANRAKPCSASLFFYGNGETKFRKKGEFCSTRRSFTDCDHCARLEQQIEGLTAGLQKVRVQLEVSKPAPQTVLNKPARFRARCEPPPRCSGIYRVAWRLAAGRTSRPILPLLKPEVDLNAPASAKLDDFALNTRSARYSIGRLSKCSAK